MKKKTAKKKAGEEKAGMEVISVKIGNRASATYKGFGGTFSSIKDSCLRKKTLPGFHEQGLLAAAELTEAGIALLLSGNRSDAKLREVMDIALLNTGAYPETGGKAEFFIDVKSEK